MAERRDAYEVPLPRPVQPPPVAAVRVRTLRFELRPDGSWVLVADGVADSGAAVQAAIASADLSAEERGELRRAFDLLASKLVASGRWRVVGG